MRMMNISRVAVGLSCLRSRGMLPAGQFPEIIVRREYRTHARKNRNIFQEPDKVDTDLRNLYSSSQFNDDDDEDDDGTSYGVPVEQEHQEQPGSKQKASIRQKNARVTSAEFIKSSVSVQSCPAPIYPEFAVIGRSNVGKSSLINMLTGRNSLAMVSKTPGKTKCINHFFISKSWYLVDLPGYSYAKTSRQNIMAWNKFTRDYFANRETLVNVFLLVDASIPPMEIDINCAAWFGESEIPFTIVYTKLDKKKKGGPPSEENIAAFEEKLLEHFEELPRSIKTSSKAGLGKNDLLQYIAKMRTDFHHYNSSFIS